MKLSIRNVRNLKSHSIVRPPAVVLSSFLLIAGAFGCNPNNLSGDNKAGGAQTAAVDGKILEPKKFDSAEAVLNFIDSKIVSGYAVAVAKRMAEEWNRSDQQQGDRAKKTYEPADQDTINKARKMLDTYLQKEAESIINSKPVSSDTDTEYLWSVEDGKWSFYGGPGKAEWKNRFCVSGCYVDQGLSAMEQVQYIAHIANAIKEHGESIVAKALAIEDKYTVDNEFQVMEALAKYGEDLVLKAAEIKLIPNVISDGVEFNTNAVGLLKEYGETIIKKAMNFAATEWEKYEDEEGKDASSKPGPKTIRYNLTDMEIYCRLLKQGDSAEVALSKIKKAAYHLIELGQETINKYGIELIAKALELKLIPNPGGDWSDSDSLEVLKTYGEAVIKQATKYVKPETDGEFKGMYDGYEIEQYCRIISNSGINAIGQARSLGYRDLEEIEFAAKGIGEFGFNTFQKEWKKWKGTEAGSASAVYDSLVRSAKNASISSP